MRWEKTKGNQKWANLRRMCRLRMMEGGEGSLSNMTRPTEAGGKIRNNEPMEYDKLNGERS